MGLISLERAYPMTLGSNIGTTTTSILASFATGTNSEYIRQAVQIAFVHLFFNITGIAIFYPLPFMRWPIPMARFLGETTARYRWFAGLYLICVFFVFPIIIFTLSLAGLVAFCVVLVPIAALIATVIIVNTLQKYKPGLTVAVDFEEVRKNEAA